MMVNSRNCFTIQNFLPASVIIEFVYNLKNMYMKKKKKREKNTEKKRKEKKIPLMGSGFWLLRFAEVSYIRTNGFNLWLRIKQASSILNATPSTAKTSATSTCASRFHRLLVPPPPSTFWATQARTPVRLRFELLSVFIINNILS